MRCPPVPPRPRRRWPSDGGSRPWVDTGRTANITSAKTATASSTPMLCRVTIAQRGSRGRGNRFCFMGAGRSSSSWAIRTSFGAFELDARAPANAQVGMVRATRVAEQTALTCPNGDRRPDAGAVPLIEWAFSAIGESPTWTSMWSLTFRQSPDGPSVPKRLREPQLAPSDPAYCLHFSLLQNCLWKRSDGPGRHCPGVRRRFQMGFSERSR